MNKKGQEIGIGIFLVVFITLIVGLALYSAATSLVGSSVTTASIVNQSVTLPSPNTTLNLNGQAIVGTVTVTNTSDGVDLTAQYVSNNSQIVNGLLTATLWANDSSLQAGNAAVASYTYEPDGYISSASGRSIALLIPIFAALALVVVALSPTMRSNILSQFGK
jgi:membrane protein insertase Oxa1/YidC/SpoIIIJ